MARVTDQSQEVVDFLQHNPKITVKPREIRLPENTSVDQNLRRTYIASLTGRLTPRFAVKSAFSFSA